MSQRSRERLLQSAVAIYLKRMAYGVAEAASFGRGVARTINGERMRFPARWSRYYPNDYEPWKQKFLLDHARGTVLDLGAHIGLYTVILSRRAVHVHAFEPTDRTRVALQRTLRLNHCRNVTVHQEAVGSRTGPVDFYDTGTVVSNANSVAPIAEATSYVVPGITIDDLGLRDVNLIKMDIEGAEYDALLGAASTLKTLSALAIEVHPRQLSLLGRTTAELWELLSNAAASVAINGREVGRAEFVERPDCFEAQVTFHR
jgi:FkbM family methyltransferase